MWFYFAVTNADENQIITFNIMNCTKPSIRPEIKPVAFSEQLNEWTNTFNVSYTKNNINQNQSTLRESSQRILNHTYYTLSFSYTFRHKGDRVYFAFIRPYTLTMHWNLLKEIKEELLIHSKTYTILNKSLQSTTEDNVTDEAKKSRECKERSKTIKKKTVIEFNAYPPDALKDYKKIAPSQRLPWIDVEDYSINTENMIYKKETLCYSFSGLPIELITITAQQ